MTDDIARQRTTSHIGHKSQRILGRDHDLIGVVGEYAFADAFGVPREKVRGDLTAGDLGVDFVINGRTIDVKTARRAHALLVEEGKCRAQFIVLAEFAPSPEIAKASARLVGWQTHAYVMGIPARDTGRGVVNHEVPWTELRPMLELRVLLGLSL